MTSGVAAKIVDRVKPCLKTDESSCAAGVHVTADEDPDRLEIQAKVSVVKAPDETDVEHYSLHWGDASKGKCVSVGFIKALPRGAPHGAGPEHGDPGDGHAPP